MEDLKRKLSAQGEDFALWVAGSDANAALFVEGFEQAANVFHAGAVSASGLPVTVEDTQALLLQYLFPQVHLMEAWLGVPGLPSSVSLTAPEGASEDLVRMVAWANDPLTGRVPLGLVYASIQDLQQRIQGLGFAVDYVDAAQYMVFALDEQRKKDRSVLLATIIITAVVASTS